MTEDPSDTPSRPRHMAPRSRRSWFGRSDRADGQRNRPNVAAEAPRGANPVGPSSDQPGGDQRAGEQSGGDQPGGDQRAGDQRAGDQRASDRPAGDQAASDQRAADRPVGDQPAGNQRGGAQRAGDQRAGDQAASDQRAADRPVGDQPAGDQGASDQPAGDHPSGDQAAGGQAVVDQPEGRGDGEGGAPPGRRRLPGWLVPLVLAVLGLAAAAGALALDRDHAAAALHPPTPTTPVLSARRAPEMIAAPVADRRLVADLQSWVAQSPPNACLVVEAGDDTLFAHNPTAPLAGASTQKLVTATALLLALGPDARLETVVGAATPVAAGIVPGDLFLVGGGDPLLATPPYAAGLNRNHGGFLTVDPAAIADAIAAAGVTRIEGSVVGDDSRYDAVRYHPAWPGRFRAQSVIGPVSALNLNDGFGYYLAPGQGPGPGATLDPATNAAAVVTELLRQRGIVVAGPPQAGQAPAELASVAELPSATVREIVAEMLTDSDNDTAEMALKEVGVAENGAGTWESGAVAASELLAEAGLPLDGVSIVDGSGLSDANRLSCQLLVELLTRPDTGPVLVEGLAVAGESGTLIERWDGTPVEGRLRAKTGSLNTVTALSGRVDPLQGGTLTFSYVLNVPAPRTITAADIERQNGLADILVAYPHGVDVNALLPVAGTLNPAS